ncbi:MAG TPA: hypothetical protein VFH48_27840 [Chloroflexota bacterium]|nr:hypothetical protein [Chloroflexota bacterium]
MTSLVMPICMVCRHLTRDAGWGYRCAAFPSGIPDAIIESRVDHRMPFNGDNGVRFWPVDDDASAYAEDLFNPAPEAPYAEDDKEVEAEVAG